MGGHATFHWNELMTNEVEKAKTFYAETLGWTFEGWDMPEGKYWVIMQDDKHVGGLMDMTGIVPEGIPPHWFSYIEVDDIDERVKKVESAGGTIIRNIFEVPEVGRIAIIQDTTGAAVGLITPVQT